jgi:phage I-like protein
MDKIEIEKSEYDELVSFKSTSAEQLVSKDNEIVTLKSEIEKQNSDIVDLKKVSDEFESYKADIAEKNKKAIENEANEYITSQINSGKILPASKEMYVKQYISYKSDEKMLDVFKNDVEKRDTIIFQNEKENDSSAKTEFKSTEDAQKAIEQVMKRERISWDKAREKILAVEVN